MPQNDDTSGVMEELCQLLARSIEYGLTSGEKVTARSAIRKAKTTRTAHAHQGRAVEALKEALSSEPNEFEMEDLLVSEGIMHGPDGDRFLRMWKRLAEQRLVDVAALSHKPERGEGDRADCGHPNPIWFADNDLWNRIMRSKGRSRRGSLPDMLHGQSGHPLRVSQPDEPTQRDRDLRGGGGDGGQQ